MAFSAIGLGLMRLMALLPKWVPVAIVAGFFIYCTGVSHGRAPYKTAQKIFDAKQVLIARHSKADISTIKQKGEKANETTKNNECLLSADDARGLSDIRTN